MRRRWTLFCRCLKAVSQDDARRLVEQVIERAHGGEIWAIKEILSRIWPVTPRAVDDDKPGWHPQGWAERQGQQPGSLLEYVVELRARRLAIPGLPQIDATPPPAAPAASGPESGTVEPEP